MQSKGLSLKLQLLLVSCVLSMVLAAASADSSSESSGSDSMDSSSDSMDSSSESMENGLSRFRDLVRDFYRPGSALRRALRAYKAQ